MMRKLKLTVGKTYLDRRGNRHTIKNQLDDFLIFRFMDTRGNRYMDTGKFVFDGESQKDLVKEVKNDTI